MADDKSGKGAYINNPEFPYKNLNIKKIERIRKSVSLGSQFFIHKNPINDESSVGREPVPRQGNLQNYANSLSKKISKSKNFIERNIEKISSLSKKNDMFLKTKKTCNRSHVVGYDVCKDGKRDIKEKATTVLGAGPLKNRATGITSGNSGNGNHNGSNNGSNNVLSKTPMNHLKHKTTLVHAKHKSAECDSARNKTSSANGYNNAEEALRIARKFPGIGERGNRQHVVTNIERSKSFARNYDVGGVGASSTAKLGSYAASHVPSIHAAANHSNSNAFLRRQKTLLGEDTTGQNRREKASSTRIASTTAGHDRSETHLRKNAQISNGMIKKNEWVDIKNNMTQEEVTQNKKQQANAQVALYHADKDKHVTNEGEKKMEKKLTEISNVVSPYEEHEMKNKGSDYVRDRKIKREGTLESQRSGDNEIGQLEYDGAGEGVDTDCTNHQRKLKPTDEGEHMYTQDNLPNGYHYGGGGVEKGDRGGDVRRGRDLYDDDKGGNDEMCESGAGEDGNEEKEGANENNEEEVAVAEESQGSGRDLALQKEANKITTPICNSNDAGAGKKEFPEKSISLNDNSSHDTVTNYSLQSRKDYQSLGDKIKLKNGTTKKLRSVDYTSHTMHNETGKALSSRYAHLDALGKKTNEERLEERLTDNKNVNDFFGNVRSSIGAFDEFLSRRLASLKGRSVPPSGMRVLNEGKEEGAHNGTTTIRGPNEGLTSRDNYSLNEYGIAGGKFMQEDFSAKYREGQSDEMEKPSEEPKGMTRTSIKSEENFLFDRNSYNNVKRGGKKENEENKHKQQVNTHYGENEQEMIVSEMEKLDDRECDEYAKKSDTTRSDKILSDPPLVQNAQMRTCGNGLENVVEEGNSPTEERNALNEDTLKKEFANSYDYEFSSSRKANHSLSGSNFSPLHKNYSTEGENLDNADESEAQSDDEDYKSVTEKKSAEDEMEEGVQVENGDEKKEMGEEMEEEMEEEMKEEMEEKTRR